MKREEYSVRISAHFLSALIYADDSGLNDQDKEQINDWLEQFDGSVDVCIDQNDDETDQEPFFGDCEICGLKSDVLDCTVIVTKAVSNE